MLPIGMFVYRFRIDKRDDGLRAGKRLRPRGLNMRLRVGAATDTGRVRDLNEDAHMLWAEQGLFVVCDGMGGCPAGEVASQMAVETIMARLSDTALNTAIQAPSEPGYLAQTSRLAEAVRCSNEFIYSQSQKDPSQTEMGTTMVGAWITQNIASLAHVGDSRAYLWHNEQLEPLTRDHSLVEAHVRAGLLDRDQSLQSDQQNILLRVLGREPEIEVELSEVPVRPGDYLLLCSDGLTRMVSDAALASAIFRLRDPQRICDYLVAAANHNGGPDNITVVVVEVIGGWWARLSNRWRRPFWGGHDAAACSAV
jgi:PPM family protein phosphatase